MKLATLPDREATRQAFTQLAADMTARDAELTQLAADGAFIAPTWHRWFAATADQLLQARDAAIALAPQAGELADLLREDVLDLGISSGLLRGANSTGKHFGKGWDTTLDRKVADALRAAELLA